MVISCWNYHTRIDMINIRENIKNKIIEIKEEYEKWAIYGTGVGAEKIWCEIEKLGYQKNVVSVFDNICMFEERYFHGYLVKAWEKEIQEVDVIFIGAEIHHREIEDRLQKLLVDIGRTDIIVINPFEYKASGEDKNEFFEYLYHNNKNEEFLPICDDEYNYVEGDTRVIAWYLPQFHQMEINNKFYGQGFTEWTNTSRTLPQFIGHYQPHIPYDVGYYDVMNPQTLMRQSWLAKKYGIYGFGFFYYWFSGKRIMEKPIQLLLEHREIDMPFCLHWATEDWVMCWDGGNNEVAFEQKIPEVEAFWKDIYPFFEDDRYIRVSGKPLLVIYKCKIFEKEEFVSFIKDLRKKATEEGFLGLYIMLSTGDGTFVDSDEWGGDALVEYQPWSMYGENTVENVLPRGYMNPQFRGRLLDISKTLEQKGYLRKYNCKKYFRSVVTSWDNSARKKERDALILLGNTPTYMKQWLCDIFEESKRIHEKEENLAFISSWNEWAEGSHLEPDYRYGYAWLNAVKEAHEESRKDKIVL